MVVLLISNDNCSGRSFNASTRGVTKRFANLLDGIARITQLRRCLLSRPASAVPRWNTWTSNRFSIRVNSCAVETGGPGKAVAMPRTFSFRSSYQNFGLAIAPELSAVIGRLESVGSEVSMFRYSADDFVGFLRNQQQGP